MPAAPVVPRLVAVASAIAAASALNNGLGLTPAMGFSSWLAFSSDVSSAGMRNVTRMIIDRGLGAKGYEYINVDEGWFIARNATGGMVEDLKKFPEGMKGFGDWVRAQERAPGKFFKYGLYSCRGTCQCSEPDYSGPGSQGFEKQDTDWMVAAGATYLKIDSCCATQDHKTAIGQYELWRDALNATGVPVYFSLCGWNDWYSPPDPSIGYLGGYSVGNQWRIQGDGDTWPALSKCMNTIAAVRQWSGPGGWADPDLIAGPNVHADGAFITDAQARTQFSVWSVMPAPLLITNNLLEASEYYWETISNDEVIAVDQDASHVPGYRLVGGDLSYPCGGGPPAPAVYSLAAKACDAGDAMQVWRVGGNGSTIGLASGGAGGPVLDDWECAAADGSPVYVGPQDGAAGKCGGRNQLWTWRADGSVVNVASGTCLDVYNTAGPEVEVWTCNGGRNQQWDATADGLLRSRGAPLCLAAVTPDPTACTNVWGRPLADGSVALVAVNNAPSPQAVSCGPACFAALNVTAAARGLAVRDLWAHAANGTLAPPFTWTAVVPGDGGSVMVRLTPVA